MTALVTSAALLVTAAAVVCAALALARTRSAAVALPVLLDLLLGATLLRLALRPTPTQLATTAALVAVKRLASVGVQRAGRTRRSSVGQRDGRV